MIAKEIWKELLGNYIKRSISTKKMWQLIDNRMAEAFYILVQMKLKLDDKNEYYNYYLVNFIAFDEYVSSKNI